MSVPKWLTLLLLLVAACKGPGRQYSRTDVIGEYVYAKNPAEGLVLREDGRFEHCWKNTKEGAGSEHGTWSIQTDAHSSTVTLLDVMINKRNLDAGLMNAGFLVFDVGGRVALTLFPDEPSRYYVKQINSQHVCPGQ